MPYLKMNDNVKLGRERVKMAPPSFTRDSPLFIGGGADAMKTLVICRKTSPGVDRDNFVFQVLHRVWLKASKSLRWRSFL